MATKSGNKKPQEILDQIGGEDGWLGPAVKSLSKILEDPILKQLLNSAPDNSKKN